MINEFLKTYKDGGMVYLDPTERDRIVEEINRLKKIDENHQRLNGELREENNRLNNIIKLQDTRNSRQRIANRKLLERNQDLVIENLKLNNIINKGIEAINVYQNEKTLSLGYQDLKRIRGILQGNEFDLQMFEKYLQELKGSDKE